MEACGFHRVGFADFGSAKRAEAVEILNLSGRQFPEDFQNQQTAPLMATAASPASPHEPKSSPSPFAPPSGELASRIAFAPAPSS
jgi:hypothetical protein